MSDTIADHACHANGCITDAEYIVEPDGEMHAILLCRECYEASEHGEAIVFIGDKSLVWLPFEGWAYLPDKWEARS